MKMREVIGILPAIAVAGCSNSYVALPDDVYEHIARQYEYAEAEHQFVENLAEKTNRNTVFNAEGQNGASSFLENLAQSQEELQWIFENDQIVGYYESDYPQKKDTLAFYDNETIVLNLDKFQEYSFWFESDLLMHEAGHALYPEHDHLFSGDPSIVYNSQTAEDVIINKDYSYLLSFFYTTAQNALLDPHSVASFITPKYQGSVDDGSMTAQEAYDALAGALTVDLETWAQRVVNFAYDPEYPSAPYASVFGWTQKEFADALRESGMLDYRKKIFLEYLCNDFVPENPGINAPDCP